MKRNNRDTEDITSFLITEPYPTHTHCMRCCSVIFPDGVQKHLDGIINAHITHSASINVNPYCKAFLSSISSAHPEDLWHALTPCNRKAQRTLLNRGRCWWVETHKGSNIPKNPSSYSPRINFEKKQPFPFQIRVTLNV